MYPVFKSVELNEGDAEADLFPSGADWVPWAAPKRTLPIDDFITSILCIPPISLALRVPRDYGLARNSTHCLSK